MAAGVLSGLHGETSYRYRKFKSDAMMAVTVGATIVTLIPLFLVLGYLLTKGVASLNWAFFTHMPAPVGEKGGGMANAIVGTFEVVGIACLIGVPIGVGAGLYLAANRASQFTNWVRFSADVLMGVPSIVVGIFAYAVIVRPFGGFSTLAGSVALAAIMIPLVTRTTEEMVLLVPPELREASLALGVPHWRTTVVGGGAHGAVGNRHRRDSGRRARGGRDGAAAVHGVRQPLLVDLAVSSDQYADGAGLHLRDFAVCRLAAAGVGGRAGADGDYPGARVGRAMGDGRGGEGAKVAMPDKLVVKNLNAYFNKNRALNDVSLSFEENRIAAIIGPSGCGKSTLVRCLNRMHEVVPGATATGEVLLDGNNIYDDEVDPVQVRRRIGMVFQKPTPFPTMSIEDNVAAGLTLNGVEVSRAERDQVIERSLRQAALWEEVKDRLRRPGGSLSGGQQQRLCVARALAVQPEVLLMDEPCSALDPISTARIEELLLELKSAYTIVIVTHNMQQAARCSDMTAFMYTGDLIEYGETKQIFTNPTKRETEDYITGRFG